MCYLHTTDGKYIIIESPVYIKHHVNDVYVVCRKEQAEGICHQGIFYLFSEGHRIYGNAEYEHPSSDDTLFFISPNT